MDISVENLTKTYGPQNAVDNVSFKVNTGEILGFLGPNGAGKTTTMKIITCYMAPSQGTVKVGEYSISENADEIKRRIGYLPEHNPLYLDMPVIEYLDFVARLQSVPKGDIAKRIKKMVQLCGLDLEKHKLIGELSKGYRQRVGLAQALIHDPEILILDEPTTGLDPNQIVEIRNLIKEIGSEKTVILSTHILPEVEATCDRMMIINKGKIVADGAPSTLRKQAQGSEVLKVTIEDGVPENIYNKLQELHTTKSVDIDAKRSNHFIVASNAEISSKRSIFQLCVQNNWVITEMIAVEKSMEDVFRNLTLN